MGNKHSSGSSDRGGYTPDHLSPTALRPGQAASEASADTIASPSTTHLAESGKGVRFAMTPSLPDERLLGAATAQATESIVSWSTGSERSGMTATAHIYPIKNDTAERDRLAHQGIAWRVATKELTPFFPSAPKAILDVGSGSGVWCQEAVRQYPEASCVGVDLQPIPPKGKVPESCTFHVGNILEGLSFSDGSFDYIHQADIALGIPTHRWSTVCRELFRLMRAGGVLELVEQDGVHHNLGPAGQCLNTWTVAATEHIGVTQSRVGDLKHLLQLAGFVRVQKHVVAIPVGAWGGKVGKESHKAFQGFWKAITPAFVASSKEVNARLIKQALELYTNEMDLRRSYYNINVYIAQKAK